MPDFHAEAITEKRTLDPDIAGIVIRGCLREGASPDENMVVGELYADDVHREYVAGPLANLEKLEGLGMDREQALGIAFGALAQTDEAGNLVRRPINEADQLIPQPQGVEKK